MPDDNVRIDPEFQSSRTYVHERRGPGNVRIAAVAIGIAVFALGWIFGVATPSEEIAAPATSTSAPPLWNTTSTTTVGAARTGVPAAAVRLPSALGAAVPGFSDAITLVVEGADTVEIVRWLPTRPEPETLVSIDRTGFPEQSGPDSPSSTCLDASGRWYALALDSGTLEVGPLPANGGEQQDLGATQTIARPAGVRIETPTWHATEPGKLMWLESQPDGGASLVALRTPEAPGVEDLAVQIVADGLAIEEWAGITSWIAPGIVLERSPGVGGSAGCVIFDDDGTEVARMPGLACIAQAPDGTTLWSPTAATSGTGYEPFLLSLDGRRCVELSYLESGERVCRAAWSPSGDRLAMSLGQSSNGPRLRIVESASGERVFDAPILMESCCALAWSPDGTRVALAARSTGSGSQIFIAEPGNQSLGMGHSETRFGDPGCTQALLWSTDGRFVVAPVWHPLSATSALTILDTDRGFEVSIPVSGRLIDTRIDGRA
ncbi:MAG: hypothetical protein ABFS21_06365 [Actinomycetota bacterium]